MVSLTSAILVRYISACSCTCFSIPLRFSADFTCISTLTFVLLASRNFFSTSSNTLSAAACSSSVKPGVSFHAFAFFSSSSTALNAASALAAALFFCSSVSASLTALSAAVRSIFGSSSRISMVFTVIRSFDKAPPKAACSSGDKPSFHASASCHNFLVSSSVFRRCSSAFSVSSGVFAALRAFFDLSRASFALSRALTIWSVLMCLFQSSCVMLFPGRLFTVVLMDLSVAVLSLPSLSVYPAVMVKVP